LPNRIITALDAVKPMNCFYDGLSSHKTNVSGQCEAFKNVNYFKTKFNQIICLHVWWVFTNVKVSKLEVV